MISMTSMFLLWSTSFPLLFGWSFQPESSHSTAEDAVLSANTNTKSCSNQPYRTHLISEDPLVIYIESFITTDEASQLVGLR
jgi:prolyl 4-hydroxylase